MNNSPFSILNSPLIPPGYKQTEVGVIPEDWEVKTTSQFANPVRGGSPRPAGDPRYFNGSHIPWLTVGSLTNIPASQLVVTETATCLTEEGSLRSRTLDPGTLIIANSGATLGVTKLLGIKCCANDGIAALLNLSKGISPRYLAHFINTKTNYLRDIVASGNGQPNLNTELIGNFRIPLPPTKAEQEAIAGALSDADALVESLEQLVAKKRQIKQGAMQELLTGKRRLPGFATMFGHKNTEVGMIPEDWSVAPLGRLIASVEYGSSAKSSQKGYTPVLRMGNLQGGKIDWTDLVYSDRDSEIKKYSLKLGDVLFNRTNTIDLVGKTAIYEGEQPAIFAGYLIRIKVDEDLLDSKFLNYILNAALSRTYSAKILSIAVGQANINSQKLKTYPIPLPPLKAEQSAIASILSDMDAEIAGLEAKVARARQVKQGMMQELLTGRIRLV